MIERDKAMLFSDFISCKIAVRETLEPNMIRNQYRVLEKKPPILEYNIILLFNCACSRLDLCNIKNSYMHIFRV